LRLKQQQTCEDPVKFRLPAISFVADWCRLQSSRLEWRYNNKKTLLMAASHPTKQVSFLVVAVVVRKITGCISLLDFP